MEGERTKGGGAAAAVRVTSHQATRCSAATATSGTQAGGRDPAELIWFFHGCVAVWLSEEEPRSFWTVSLNAASLPVMERCSRTPWDWREVAGWRLISMEGRKQEETGVFAQMSAVAYVFVSREGEKIWMETRRRRSWREGTVTGLRGGNEKGVCVGGVLSF